MNFLSGEVICFHEHMHGSMKGESFCSDVDRLTGNCTAHYPLTHGGRGATEKKIARLPR